MENLIKSGYFDENRSSRFYVNRSGFLHQVEGRRRCLTKILKNQRVLFLTFGMKKNGDYTPISEGIPPSFYKMQKREKAGERKVRSADIGSEKERKEWKKSYLYEEMIYGLVCS